MAREVSKVPEIATKLVTDFTELKKCKRIVLSLCGGMEMLRTSAIQAGFEFDAWVCVEIDDKIRQLAMHIAAQDDKPSPEYVAFDIYDLTLDSLRVSFS